ncbi:hypothetical protein Q7O_003982 [Pectobacterium carotovorum subsp. carotovorum PCCS1]|nr:hypothetical protein [Pectobacterium carotovorum subsp. carotovorum PCCS1]
MLLLLLLLAVVVDTLILLMVFDIFPPENEKMPIYPNYSGYKPLYRQFKHFLEGDIVGNEA